MFDTSDTIVAIATPVGRAGLGVIRISGTDAQAVAGRILTLRRPLASRRATLTQVRAVAPDEQVTAPRGAHARPALVDQVVATLFPGPRSYTGEDCVEISAHGSPLVLRQIVDVAQDAGARLAEPGEFTLRAFLNGKIDLVQAEAIRDLIDAVTPAQARVAFDQLEGTLTSRIIEVDRALFELVAKLEASLDFPDEGYHFIEADEVGRSLDALQGLVGELLADGHRGRMIREGCQVAIVGRPNVGKSSLFNALAGAERAIVTGTAGTTRDLLTERVDIEGVSVTLVDTAGMREPEGEIEREGVRRSHAAIEVADVVVVVLDGSERLTSEDEEVLERTSRRRRLIVANKVDLAGWRRDGIGNGSQDRFSVSAVAISATTGAGLAELKRALLAVLGVQGAGRDEPMVTNVRHLRLLDRVESALTRARAAATDGLSEELVLADLQVARTELGLVTGQRTPDDLLRHIFSSFCVGK